jgi:uncharacterized membrane protein YsdA (DUF1294 family)
MIPAIFRLNLRPWIVLLATLPWLARVATNSDLGREVSFCWLAAAGMGAATRALRSAEWGLLASAAIVWGVSGWIPSQITWAASTAAYAAFMLLVVTTDRQTSLPRSIDRLPAPILLSLAALGGSLGVWIGLQRCGVSGWTRTVIAMAVAVIVYLSVVLYRRRVGSGVLSRPEHDRPGG